MAVLSGAPLSGEPARARERAAKQRKNKKPRSFTALAHLGLFARPTKTAMLRRLNASCFLRLKTLETTCLESSSSGLF